MADNHTKEQRSYNMSRIRSKNNAPEEKVRKFLFSEGLDTERMIRNFLAVRTLCCRNIKQ